MGANARREGKPASQHVSIKGGALRIRSNNDYRRDLLVDMLQTVGYLGIGLGIGLGLGLRFGLGFGFDLLVDMLQTVG